MPLTKKFVLILFLSMLAATSLTAQTPVKVKKETARVKGENLEGFEVELEGTLAEVSSALVKFLKSVGKVKQSSELITVNEPTVNGATYTFPVFGVTKDKGQKAAAWIGIKAADWPADNAKNVNKELEKMLREFGVKFNKDKIQVQIDESARAYQAVEKQQQKLTNENKNLNVRLEDNKREKIQLEKSIENNKLENTTLLKKMEKNKHDQDSVAQAGVQIKKVMELHKQRQQKVN